MSQQNSLLASMRELVDNPTPRVPVALCLDVSYSMTGKPIQELESGLQQYRSELLADDLTRYAAETAVITYSGHADCLSDFCTADKLQLPQLTADGSTDMGAGLTLALDRLEARKAQYRSGGVDYYQPILVLMTDGQPNGDPRLLSSAINRLQGLVNNRKLTLIAVGLGPEADMDVLRSICVKGQPLHLDRLQFRELFTWLSRSVAEMSNSLPGTEAEPDLSLLAQLVGEPWPDSAL